MNRFLLSLTVSLISTQLVMAEEQPGDAAELQVSYSQQIEPILRRNCQGCHQPAKPQGGYVMTEFERLIGMGDSGETAVVAGKPEQSYLLDQIRVVDGEAAMPKKGPPLHASEFELIARWIEQGALDDSPRLAAKFDAENPPQYSRPPVVTAIAFSPDGKWMASSGFQEVLLVSTATWKTEKRLIGLSERIESISFSPDSHRVAVTGGSPGRLGEVQVWKVDSGELLLSHQVTYDTIYGGCFSPDGKLIAFGCADNTVRAIDSETGEQKLHQGAHDDWIRACVFNPDGTHLLSAGRDMTVKLTEVATERFVDNVTSITPGALLGGVNSLAMHPSRNEVLVGGSDGIPKVYRIFRETERRIGDDANLIRQFPSTNARIFSVAVSLDGKLLAAASTLDGKSKVQVYPYDFDGALTDTVKAAMQKRVAERTPEESKVVDDYINGTSAPVCSLEIDSSSLYAISFSPDGKHLALGGSDGHLRILNVSSATMDQDIVPVEVASDTENHQDTTEQRVAGNGMPLPSDSLPEPDQERSLLPKSQLLELQVHPQQIVLDSPVDYVQLVVTAVYAGGQACDVTRLCGFEVGGSQDGERKSVNVSVSSIGLVRPTASGSSTMSIRFADLEQRVDVRVGDLLSTEAPDFIRDVNPLLSRLGCNAGTCHGAQNGKNGFKLSLRGYDPVEDIRALSDDLCSRRLNVAAADASLMLLKPIGSVPHEGGVLLTKDSVQYAIIRDWIAGGAKLDRSTQKVASIEIFPKKPVIELEGGCQQFRVVAQYPDGSSRDVTHEAFVESGNSEVCKSLSGGRVLAVRRGEAPLLVRYEGAYAAATVTIMGNREGFAWQEPASFSTIDRLVADKWERMKIFPSPLTDDSSFLRRVRLDLTGLPPTPEEIRVFLSDPLPSKLKRQAKIDELLGSKDYVEHWTNKWSDLLQVNSKFIGIEGAKAFRNWIREAIDENRPYDVFAREILTAEGSNKDNPAASYYKILRDPDLMMENTTHLFLAVRFNCNKCHDHPFERWTQDQYYELAAYFARTGLRKDPASGENKIGGTAVEGAKPLYEEVYDMPEGEITHIRTGQTVAPAFPYDCEYDAGQNASRREQLAAWITAKDNPYFAKSFVNRLWGYLTGMGLIEPLDDIRAGNPPTNPELLDHLANEFMASGFDVQHVLRLICNSRTYQLSVSTNQWNQDDGMNYSHAQARRLPAEVLYDAVYHVTGAISEIPGVEPGTRAAALPDVAVQLADGFLNNLGRPVRESACECERSQDLQLGPVMALVSGPTVGKAISDPKCDLPRIAEKQMSEEAMVREIYLRVLSREATDDEVLAVLATADQIAIDHSQLKGQLASRETWWQGEKAKREELRLAELEKVKQAIVTRREEMAPEREQMEQERQKRLAEAKQKLEAYETQGAKLANEYLAEQREQNHWFPLAPSSLASSNKDRLIAQGDRSIVASGMGDKGVYTVTFQTPLNDIRGFRLEALPMAGIEGGGPGLSANGNFVVTEIEVSAAPLKNPKEKQVVAIGKGVADFSQPGFDPEQVYDGNNRDQRGWAVSPRGGSIHWATFEFAKPVENEGGSILEFKIYQNHNAAQHRLAHFRLSVTTDSGDLQLGFPEEFAALQVTTEAERSRESLEVLLSYLEKNDKTWQDLKTLVSDAQKPLPEDEQLAELQRTQKGLETETPDDPKLVQLRADFAASEQQVKNQRLTLAQDLTWALINSPAFLFNH